MATNGFIGSAGAKPDTSLEKGSSKPGELIDSGIVREENGRINYERTQVATKAHDWTNHVLRFLSHASNETLGACLVGLGAITYLVLGRVGLVIIGIVGGVVLHATWEDSSQGQANDEAGTSKAKKRHEKGLDIVQRVLDWRERNKHNEQRDTDTSDSSKVTASKELDFSGFEVEIGAALTGFTDAVIKDYVKWWYLSVLPGEASFPFQCRQTLTAFLLRVSTHLSRKRPADVLLDFLTNSSSIVIVFLSELSHALRGSSGIEPADAINKYLEDNSSSSLANVLARDQQTKKLKTVADDILQAFLDSKIYNCDPVRVFLREILAGVVLDMTVTSCSRPEFINNWIIYALEEGDTTELIQAIDAGVNSATGSEIAEASTKSPNSIPTSRPDGTPQLSDADSQAKFEHKRTISEAEKAMDEAMQEAKRLSELIAVDEAGKLRGSEETWSSGETTAAVETPTSSQDDLATSVNGSLTDPPIGSGSIPQAEDLANSETALSFTSFDQITDTQPPTALMSGTSLPQSQSTPPLTLHKASVSIFDDSLPGEEGTIRSKSTVELLLQIEPVTSQHPGWMIARKYSDFETLHEVLRRISVVSGVAAFSERYQTVPGWKGQTKLSLRSSLEHYLRDALTYQRLAESEGMKRFLEKDQGLAKASPSVNKGGFGFPSPAAFETMGKGMLDVLASAPKGAAGGGKAILGGVTGVLGGVGSLGQKKQISGSPAMRGSGSPNSSSPYLPRSDSNSTTATKSARGRESQESSRPSTSSQESLRPPPLPRRQSGLARQQNHNTTTNGNIAEEQTPQPDAPRDPSPPQPPDNKEDGLHLPPPPSEIPDNYKTTQPPPRLSTDANRPLPTSPPKPAPLSTPETTVAIELFFATITELYTLSSAWSLRLTLLNAAKSFLLRPGNPSLESIRLLLQSTLIDAQSTPQAIATHINKIRENALPSKEELEMWPKELGEEEKVERRVRARRLLVEKGMPGAIMGVMGSGASGEALGRVFDSLQVEEVGRGLVFALVLQGVRALVG